MSSHEGKILTEKKKKKPFPTQIKQEISIYNCFEQVQDTNQIDYKTRYKGHSSAHGSQAGIHSSTDKPFG